MLGEIGISILVLMLFVFALNAVFGIIVSIVLATKRMYTQSVKSIIYLIGLGVTTILASLPFLRMHGSYSDLDRVLIIVFCLFNIALILVYIVTRLKALSGARH